MSSNEKVSNVLGDRREELVTTPLLEKKSSTNDVGKGTDELADMPLMEKKYSTKDVDKGTDEMADMKTAEVKIRRKGLDLFEGKSKGSKGWFKTDIGFLKTTFSTSHSELYKRLLKIILSIKTRNRIQRLLYRLMNNLSIQIMKK